MTGADHLRYDDFDLLACRALPRIRASDRYGFVFPTTPQEALRGR